MKAALVLLLSAVYTGVEQHVDANSTPGHSNPSVIKITTASKGGNCVIIIPVPCLANHSITN